jgi:hypothetical protein
MWERFFLTLNFHYIENFLDFRILRFAWRKIAMVGEVVSQVSGCEMVVKLNKTQDNWIEPKHS